MTKIKICGLRREEDIALVNRLRPEYIGFVLVPGRRRAVTREVAARLKKLLDPGITAVGVFIDESLAAVEELLGSGVIDAAQLHGGESEEYVAELRARTGKPVIKAFILGGGRDPGGTVAAANRSPADCILLDGGTGGGKPFDENLLSGVTRPYFLAGGLDPQNVAGAVARLNPYAVDVSSGVETDGVKDPGKAAAFVRAVRGEETDR